MFYMNYTACRDCVHYYEADERECEKCVHNSTENFEPLNVAERINHMCLSELTMFIYGLLEKYKDQETPDAKRIADWLKSYDIDTRSI